MEPGPSCGERRSVIHSVTKFVATDFDPKICYTDTHGYTEVAMATAALLGYKLNQTT